MSHPAPCPSRGRLAAAVPVVAALLATPPGIASPAPPPADPGPAAEPSTGARRTLDVAACLADGARALLAMQESLAEANGRRAAPARADEGGDDPVAEPTADAAAAEWPYEGVYRVRGRIPIGYRVGGTAIGGTAMLATPGWREDPARRAAVHRAATFVAGQVDHPSMAFPYPPSYDVRGWGYCYGLDFLLRLEAAGELPEPLATRVGRAIDFYLGGLVAIALEDGGWNYALSPNRIRHAPFMTAPVLRALFRAAASGRDVPAAVVERGLDALEAARMPSGAIVYMGTASPRQRASIPGATGRMLTADATLVLAGRSDRERLRTALAAFFEHWDELEKRRRRTGTHVPPHGIAPYYFFYAHHAAALAIELLPEDERADWRARLHDRLAVVREPDGTWNDRVFARSANYGTAMTMLALGLPETGPPPGWPPPAPATAPATTPPGAGDGAGDDAGDDVPAPGP